MILTLSCLITVVHGPFKEVAFYFNLLQEIKMKDWQDLPYWDIVASTKNSSWNDNISADNMLSW